MQLQPESSNPHSTHLLPLLRLEGGDDLPSRNKEET